MAHIQVGVEGKTYLIIIGSTYKEQNQRKKKTKLALWDGVMVVLHKIKNDHDARDEYDAGEG